MSLAKHARKYACCGNAITGNHSFSQADTLVLFRQHGHWDRQQRHTINCMTEMRYAYKLVLRKSEGKKPLDRPRLRGEDIVKVTVQVK